MAPHSRPDTSVLLTEAAARMVRNYAPLLRRGFLPPVYQQPLITWRLSPACDPAFAAFLRATWARLDLRDATQFSEEEALLLRYLRLHGLKKLYNVGLSAANRSAPESWHQRQVDLLTCLLGAIIAEALLTLMTPEDRAQWFPWHCFDIRPGRKLHDVTLYVDSLCAQPLADGQLVYYARHRPTVLLQGVRLCVAFTTHALQRIHERLGAAPGSHGSLVDAFAYTNYLQVFIPAQVYPDQPAFALVDQCTQGFWNARYAQVLLDTLDPNQTYAYRLGYCPTMQANGFHVAKTLLVPGYIGTPEYGALFRASLNPGVKEQMLAQCRGLAYAHIARLDDVRLFRWFHTHGVPQVIPAPPDLFVYD